MLYTCPLRVRPHFISFFLPILSLFSFQFFLAAAGCAILCFFWLPPAELRYSLSFLAAAGRAALFSVFSGRRFLSQNNITI